MLAMVSESRKVKKIFQVLLGSTGCAFSVQPSTRYCAVDEELSFYQLCKRAMDANEILCGYQAHNSTDDTVLNPREKHICRTWKDMDFVLIQEKNKHEQHSDQLLLKGTAAFEDAARHRRVNDLLLKNQDTREQVKLATSLAQSTVHPEESHVVEVTRDILQRLSTKLALILQECEQSQVA
jgi:hypothetical protein